MNEKQKYNSNWENLSLKERGGLLGNYAKDVEQWLSSLEASKSQDMWTLKDVMMKVSSMEYLISRSDNNSDKKEVKEFLNRAMNIVSEYLVVLDDKEGLLSDSEKKVFDYLKDVFNTCEEKLDTQNKIKSKVQEQIERIKAEIEMRSEDKRENIIERWVISSEIQILDNKIVLKDDDRTLELSEGKGFKIDPTGGHIFSKSKEEWRKSHDFTMESFKLAFDGIKEGEEIDILAPVEVKKDGETKIERKKVIVLTRVNWAVEVTESTRHFDKISTEINTPIESIDLSNTKNITDVISDVDLKNEINVALRWNNKKTSAFLTNLISKVEWFENIANLEEVLVILKEQPELLPKFNENFERISNMLMTTSGEKMTLIDKIQGQEKGADAAKEAFIEREKLKEAARVQAEKIGAEANLDESSIEKIRKAIFEGWIKVSDNETWVFKDTHLHMSYWDKWGVWLHQTILELRNKEGVELNLALGVW